MCKIFCSNCESDLTYSMGGYDHCFVLQDRKYGPHDQHILDYYCEPVIEEKKFFCGLDCLYQWVEKIN